MSQSPENQSQEEKAPESGKPEITLMQEDHKVYAVMRFNHRFAAHRVPRQVLQMSEEEQRWYFNSQGIAKKLFQKMERVIKRELPIVPVQRTRGRRRTENKADSQSKDT